MKIIVVSQDGCNPCTMVKNFLNGEGVEFESVNISKTPEDIEKYNVMSTPVTILLDEDEEELVRVAGFNRPQLEVLLSQL